MTLVEAAEAVLLDSKNTPLTAREISDIAAQRKLINPKSQKPWVHLHAALKAQNSALAVAGKREKFSFLNGKWKLI